MNRKSAGFTLLELLVAVAIFAVIGVVCYQFISTLDKVDSRTSQRVGHLKQLQRALSMLDKDTLQIVSRPVRDPEQYNVWKLPVEGNGERLELTKTGVTNALGANTSSLKRVEYFLEDEKLRLKIYPSLDGDGSAEIPVTTLLDGVESMELRYLELQESENKKSWNWQSQWPPETAVDPGQDYPQPAAIELKITTPYLGEIKRFFQVTRNEFQ